MINVKNVTEHDLQNKVKWFILHIFKLFRKFLKNPLIGTKVFYYCTLLASIKTAIEVLFTMKLPYKSKHDANGSLLYLKSFGCPFMSVVWFKILSRLHLLFLLNKIYDFKLQGGCPNPNMYLTRNFAHNSSHCVICREIIQQTLTNQKLIPCGVSCQIEY